MNDERTKDIFKLAVTVTCSGTRKNRTTIHRHPPLTGTTRSATTSSDVSGSMAAHKIQESRGKHSGMKSDLITRWGTRLTLLLFFIAGCSWLDTIKVCFACTFDEMWVDLRIY